MTHASLTHDLIEKMQATRDALEQFSSSLEHRLDTLETGLVLTKCVTALRICQKQRLDVSDKRAIRAAIEDAVTVLKKAG